MLAVSRFIESMQKGKRHVLCTTCHRGRLCDTMQQERIRVLSVEKDRSDCPEHVIILKCPKCGALAAISILNEN